MGDTFALERCLDEHQPETAIIVGTGYVGLEMAEALIVRGLLVTQLQRGHQVLSTLDPELGSLVRAELNRHGVDVLTGTRIQAGTRDGDAFSRSADLVLVVVGVRSNTSLLTAARATTGVGLAPVARARTATLSP